MFKKTALFLKDGFPKGRFPVKNVFFRGHCLNYELFDLLKMIARKVDSERCWEENYACVARERKTATDFPMLWPNT